MDEVIVDDQNSDGSVKPAEDIFRVHAKKRSDADADGDEYLQLRKALRRKDWKKIEQFVIQNPDALLDTLGGIGDTLLSTLAGYGDDESLRLLEKFLNMLLSSAKDLPEKKIYDCLELAAAEGNTKAAEIFMKFEKKLPNMSRNFDISPLYFAAAGGHRETFEYLLSVTEIKDSSDFASETAFDLLDSLIQYNFFDIALNLLKSYPKLAREENCHRSVILQTLATKPKAFASGSRHWYWKHLIYQHIPVQEEVLPAHQTEQNDVHTSVEGDAENPIHNSSTENIAFGFLPKLATTTFGALSQKSSVMFWNALMLLAPCIKGIRDKKLMHIQTVEIVRMMCGGVKWDHTKASETLKMPILGAAKLGIYEIVNEILDVYSGSLVNEDGHNIHMIAVLHRQEELFKRLIQEKGTKLLLETSFDKSKNNILHLAGRLVPSSEVAGVVLQMQRELQWFKAVKNCVSPSILEKRNNENKTPEEVFMEEHKELVEKGEKWMKETAQSCSVVVSLIITVVFAAAFTVPGGNSPEGIPIFLRDLPFIVFITSDALALFSSTTSLLMFLGILTSRYSQEDFLVSLPKKLIIGLISMFFSIATMMVAFGATVYLVLSHPWKWVIVPVALLGCIPVTLFALLQFPLLVEMFFSTYRPSLFQPINFGW